MMPGTAASGDRSLCDGEQQPDADPVDGAMTSQLLEGAPLAPLVTSVSPIGSVVRMRRLPKFHPSDNLLKNDASDR
jgi:hypothetical protein